MKLLNKIIRKVSGAEVAQQTVGGLGDGKANESIVPLLRKAGADGCVLLKNDNNVLPFTEDDNVALFGRVQNDWFFVGNGSGGDVIVPYRTSLINAIEAEKPFKVNEELKEIYKNWSEKHKVDPGFWAHWPRFYPEMPLSKEDVARFSKDSNKAVVIVGRSAGEDRENVLEKGSFYLTDKEIKLLDEVCESFDKVVLILNIGSVIDFEKIAAYGDKISSILIVWQGGMESGNSVCDVLSGKVNPSGKLTDTIAKKYEYYPSADCFGNKDSNNYTEDIYVGYRYFETFKPDRVLYEFGFGLSYTDFDINCTHAEYKDGKVSVKASVKNIGSLSGREVLQLYCEAPQGKLGKAARSLVGFAKTPLIAPGGEETLTITVDEYTLSSYDDTGATGNKACYVLESGEYSFLLGVSSKNCEKVFEFTLEEDKVIETLTEQMAVGEASRFVRMVPKCEDGKIKLSYNSVPARTVDLKAKILANLPEGTGLTGDKGYKLQDVKDGKVSLDEFVAQLSLDELELITRGEGMMDSKLGAKGNAGAIGGVSESLRDKGIPPVTTTDGPSGIRLLATCSLLPCGTLLACTWDTALVEELCSEVAKEMVEKGSDILLAPGMNIHRNPLCGRNFEYFSEDPLVSGKIAAAYVTGIQSQGVSACPKHFACNNQEYNRIHTDAVVSERALREIYLKGFEICVKEAKPKNIMTSYNKINGVWSHYNYELCTDVLRGEWGYEGSVMTDWWMRYAPSPEFPDVNGNAYRVRAQVDVLMPGAKTAISKSAESDGTLLETYGKDEGITLGEMQRSAKNVLRMCMDLKM
ncbi:MAG: glycoside hydrolase family 3 C-terminal domain-containing protein [Clostridiaceae bacterium]|nr:glycoside hydrolase family 3 C-terminal domain-containing protein [Clostridiaceae bacterium]